MNAKKRERLDAFIPTGTSLKKSWSGAVIARQWTGFQTLVDVRGSKTAAGAYYEAQTGLGLSVGGSDTSQAPFREGDRINHDAKW